jgi:hypothetical protein
MKFAACALVALAISGCASSLTLERASQQTDVCVNSPSPSKRTDAERVKLLDRVRDEVAKAGGAAFMNGDRDLAAALGKTYQFEKKVRAVLIRDPGLPAVPPRVLSRVRCAIDATEGVSEVKDYAAWLFSIIHDKEAADWTVGPNSGPQGSTNPPAGP